MIIIGERIKELRKKEKYTQTELANLLGVTKSTIAAYENNSRLPSYDVLIKMAEVFKVSIDSLLLDRTEVVLDAHGLSIEQVHILNNLISYFRRRNIIEDMFVSHAPELKELVNDNLSKRIDDKK